MNVITKLVARLLEEEGKLAGTEDWSPKDRKDAYDAFVGHGKYADVSEDERQKVIADFHAKYS